MKVELSDQEVRYIRKQLKADAAGKHTKAKQEMLNSFQEKLTAPKKQKATDTMDLDRLKGQLGIVYSIMKGGKWHTLESIATEAHKSFQRYIPQVSVSSRIRELRQPHKGSHTVDREYLGNGVFQYRLATN